MAAKIEATKGCSISSSTSRGDLMNKVIEQIRPFCEQLSKTNVGYIGKLKPEVNSP
jgi:hypothetical protein